MKKIVSILLVFLVVIIAGCSNHKEPEKKNDQPKKEMSFSEKQQMVSTFINEDVYAIAEVQLKAFDSLQQVMDDKNNDNDQRVYRTIVNETIPAFEMASQLTKDIHIQFSDLEIPRKFLLDSIEAYKEGLELRAQSIEEDRQDLKQTSEARFVEYGQLFKQYNKSIKHMAEKYQVSYKPIEVMEDQDLNQYKVKQDRIIIFINEDSERVAAYEKQASDFMDSVSGENYTDKQTEYEILINKVIPAYKKALNEAKNINPIIDELKEPQQMLEKATETIVKCNQMRAEAIEKHDEKLERQAEELYNTHQKEIAAYEKKLQKLTDKFEVAYNQDSDGLKASKKHP